MKLRAAVASGSLLATLTTSAPVLGQSASARATGSCANAIVASGSATVSVNLKCYRSLSVQDRAIVDRLVVRARAADEKNRAQDTRLSALEVDRSSARVKSITNITQGPCSAANTSDDSRVDIRCAFYQMSTVSAHRLDIDQIMSRNPEISRAITDGKYAAAIANLKEIRYGGESRLDLIYYLQARNFDTDGMKQTLLAFSSSYPGLSFKSKQLLFDQFTALSKPDPSVDEQFPEKPDTDADPADIARFDPALGIHGLAYINEVNDFFAEYSFRNIRTRRRGAAITSAEEITADEYDRHKVECGNDKRLAHQPIGAPLFGAPLFRNPSGYLDGKVPDPGEFYQSREDYVFKVSAVPNKCVLDKRTQLDQKNLVGYFNGMSVRAERLITEGERYQGSIFANFALAHLRLYIWRFGSVEIIQDDWQNIENSIEFVSQTHGSHFVLSSFLLWATQLDELDEDELLQFDQVFSKIAQRAEMEAPFGIPEYADLGEQIEIVYRILRLESAETRYNRSKFIRLGTIGSPASADLVTEGKAKAERAENYLRRALLETNRSQLDPRSATTAILKVNEDILRTRIFEELDIETSERKDALNRLRAVWKRYRHDKVIGSHLEEVLCESDLIVAEKRCAEFD